MSNIDRESLKTLLYNFYNLTGIKTCLYDSYGNEICSYPVRLSPFCEAIRKDEKIDQLCKDCDKRAFSICREKRTQHTYTCHAGLQECVSPIIYEGSILGFIMIGQIKNTARTNSEALNDIISDQQLPELLDAYENLPVISAEKLSSVFQVLDACAGYELLKNQLKDYNKSIESRIDKYIRNNPTAPLSVPRICSEYHLSRYELYNTFNKYFGCTPSDYIKKCRLELACELLVKTELPVNQVAIRCGIPDYNYFSKVFKSRYGISPTQYRKNQSVR